MPDPDNPAQNGGTESTEPVPLWKRLSHLLRRGPAHSMRESLEEMIEESDRQSPAFSAHERVMLANLLKFGELRVDDVMVPRADIVAIDESTPLCELVSAFRAAQHSRLPIYRGTLDDPTGMIHIKDVLGLVEFGADGILRFPEMSIAKIKRELLFAPPSMRAMDLLLKMRGTRLHLALVIDEYGGTDGLVSIEDLVEQIVGEIEDEHDLDERPILKRLANGSFEADARVDLDDFKNETGIELKPTDPEEDVDTLGGLVVSLLGRLPLRGEIVPHPAGYEFEVLEADPRRVKRLRIRPTPRPKPMKAA